MWTDSGALNSPIHSTGIIINLALCTRAFHFTFRYSIIIIVSEPFYFLNLALHVLFWIFPKDQNWIISFFRKHLFRGLLISLQLPLKPACAALCYNATKPGPLITGCQLLILLWNEHRSIGVFYFCMKMIHNIECTVLQKGWQQTVPWWGDRGKGSLLWCLHVPGILKMAFFTIS